MSRFANFSGVYIIAEVGINHNGDMAEAKKLIKAAVDAGANGVKIQVRQFDAVYTKAVLEDSLKAEQGTQYLMSELKRAHLTFDQVRELFEYAKQFDADFFATPFDQISARFLNELGVEIFKIGSPDMTNLPLLATVADFSKPIIVSTGMSDESEIDAVVKFLQARGADFALLHCNSTYPASNDTINLRFMQKMQQSWNVKVGYSGHEENYAPTLAAVALGARIVERHITSDRAHAGPDHRASLLPDQFAAMVADIRIIEQTLGESSRSISQGERSNRLSLGKSLVAARNLPSGTVLKDSDLIAKTPAKGVSPLLLNDYVGKELTFALKADDYILSEHVAVKSGRGVQRAFEINKRWGVVGRLNDFRDYLDLKPDLMEIHLTWRDLFEKRAVDENFEQELVVHAPEYYKDKLIDFTSPDPHITEYSIEMLQRTIALARDLAPHFKGLTDPRGPRVVVHPGGHFSKPTDTDKTEQYRLLMKRLRNIDSDGVRLLVENMPPRPWYFGGQWFNTIFMDGREIAQFAKEMDWGVCFDTSHAGLYCNLAGIPLADCTRAVLDHIAYLHVSDSRGSTEEGLQIGEGEIDFEQFFAIVSKIDTGFIPEIWQGHLNRGQGFKDALHTLEKVLAKVGAPSCAVHGDVGCDCHLHNI